MGCCIRSNLPSGWSAVPKEANNQYILINIQNRQAMPRHYRALCWVRVAVLALFVIGITAAALHGRWSSFPADCLKFLKGVDWVAVGLGVAACIPLVVGTAMVVRRALQTQDPLTHQKAGRVTGNAHWVSAVYVCNEWKEGGPVPVYIDTSTLDEHRNGEAYMYGVKREQDHYSVGISVIAFTPVHMVGAIVYNILRLVIAPLYIGGRLIYEKWTGNHIEDGRPFTWKDIPREMGHSVYRIVKAPFYALGMIFSALYSFVDPLNGRKMGAYVERAWNEGVTRAQGFWSVRGPQSLWQWEGGGKPSHLGENGFYLAGCWQPVGRVYYRDGKIDQSEVRAGGESLTRAHVVEQPDRYPQGGERYYVYDPENTLEKHNGLIGSTELTRPDSRVDVAQSS